MFQAKSPCDGVVVRLPREGVRRTVRRLEQPRQNAFPVCRWYLANLQPPFAPKRCNLIKLASQGPVWGWTRRKRAQIAGLVGELEELGSRTLLVRRFYLDFLTMFFREALIIGHLGDTIRHLRTKRLCDQFSRNLAVFDSVVEHCCDN
jgi:hypothetical protein